MHKHFITMIETDDPELYEGPRICIFHTRKEAEDDMLSWINDIYFQGENTQPDVNITMDRYYEATGRFCKIEEYDQGKGDASDCREYSN